MDKILGSFLHICEFTKKQVVILESMNIGVCEYGKTCGKDECLYSIRDQGGNYGSGKSNE